jgi:hypothetical protein
MSAGDCEPITDKSHNRADRAPITISPATPPADAKLSRVGRRNRASQPLLRALRSSMLKAMQWSASRPSRTQKRCLSPTDDLRSSDCDVRDAPRIANVCTACKGTLETTCHGVETEDSTVDAGVIAETSIAMRGHPSYFGAAVAGCEHQRAGPECFVSRPCASEKNCGASRRSNIP